MDRQHITQKAERFFEEIWAQEDAWALDSSAFEHARYNALIAALDTRRYGKALEIGCGAGAFTARLAPLANHILAMDISATAIEKARQRLADLEQVTLRSANVMEADHSQDGPFDLIVFSETVYYLGWLYPFFDMAWLASELYRATAPGGRMLLANSLGVPGDYLLLPWVVRTYHDLFRNVGYVVESENTFHGEKDGTPIDVLITVFEKREYLSRASAKTTQSARK